MQGKIIIKTSDDYGKTIDVVWNPYMNKYTDGKKLYPKETLSFDDVEEKQCECKNNDKIEKYAFELFREKVSDDALRDEDEIEALVKFSYNLAKKFVDTVNSLTAPVTEPEKTDSYYESLLDSQPVEEEEKIPEDLLITDDECPQPVATMGDADLIEPAAPVSDKGLSDFLKELDSEFVPEF